MRFVRGTCVDCGNASHECECGPFPVGSIPGDVGYSPPVPVSASTTIGFVEWSCGCIGLLLDGQSIVMHPCDLNGDECWTPLRLQPRDQTGKTVRPLEPDRVATLIASLDRLVADGYRLRQIRSTLSAPEGP